MRVVTVLIFCLALILGTTAMADIIVIDDFSTPFGNDDGYLRVWGDQPYDEWADVAPVGAVGDRHSWYRGWDFEYPSQNTGNYVQLIDLGLPDGGMVNFGGFDFNHEFAFEYGLATPLDLDISSGYAFSLSWMFSDIPAGNPVTITVQTGAGEGTFVVIAPFWSDFYNPIQLLFPFEAFTGTPDWSDVDSISLNFTSIDEFGPDAVFDTFVVQVQTVATEHKSWDGIKSLYR